MGFATKSVRGISRLGMGYVVYNWFRNMKDGLRKD